jgi:hypothetical protein
MLPADGKMQVVMFVPPSELPDGCVLNDQWDQVFHSYPKLLPLNQILSLQDAQMLVPLMDGFSEDGESSDELLSG